MFGGEIPSFGSWREGSGALAESEILEFDSGGRGWWFGADKTNIPPSFGILEGRRFFRNNPEVCEIPVLPFFFPWTHRAPVLRRHASSRGAGQPGRKGIGNYRGTLLFLNWNKAWSFFTKYSEATEDTRGGGRGPQRTFRPTKTGTSGFYCRIKDQKKCG